MTFKTLPNQARSGSAGGGAGGGNEPLLSDWAITVHDGFLLFASHEDIIKEAIDQSEKGAGRPLKTQPDYQRISTAKETEMGSAPICGWRVNRSALAYRAQYELFKQGKLQGGKGMFATALENLLETKSEIEQPKKAIVDGSKLPAFDAISKYLQPSGTYIRTLDNGWSYGSFAAVFRAAGSPSP